MHGDALLLRVDPSQQLGVCHKGPEGQEAGNEEPNGCFERPLVVDLPEHCEPDIGHPQDAVRHADDPNCLWHVEAVFEGHCNAEQEQVGDGLPGAD